ncbi:hypothetical protein BpHYR1_050963 [Brachionus plicatilis]|uniref:FHF complex subunit HOOK-interacting protein C-terminal domain-containing protein n=1 Tax=Brachionus plicatilis TaxID=10195 RepID=A0A3M7QXB5_BRAPC|nr:hypothetical protein BpHYR1_050963 [Brachionus plicatilis]
MLFNAQIVAVSHLVSQQARDSLLMIMQLSSRNSNLAKYIVYNTDFCPILATGLSGLYSELPQKLDLTENIDEIRYLQKADILNIPSLNKFVNSLEFCNNVIQVSHSLIANQLLQYVYYGFLIPVIAPALTQNNSEEIIAATLYLDIFLRTINEPNLVKMFLKFILYSKFDERITLLDTLVYRINANNKLCLVTLMFFYTLVDLNSEDVMYKLVFSYLMPCRHLMKSQIASLKQNPHEINGSNAQTFLSLSTDFSDPDRNNKSMIQSMDRTNQVSIPINFSTLNSSDPLYKWLHSMSVPNNLELILEMLDSMNFNFVDYLKDSKQGILSSSQKSHKWSSTYDFVSDLTNLNSTKILDKPSQELEYDPEEFLFNLNISSGSINENTKSTRSTINLFPRELNTDLDSLEYDSSSITSVKIKPERSKKSRSSDNSRRKRKNRALANDFYVLSFDNELSESSGSEESENDEKIEKNDELEEEDDLTATSLSSTATLNNELTSQISNEPSSQYRDQLMDYFFYNEENNKLFLNSSLENFLKSIDAFFSNSLQETQRDTIESDIRKNGADLDALCGEILEIYSQVFSTDVKERTNEIPHQTTSNALTAFPLYNESMNTSTNSSSTNNQTFDSGVESTNSANKENDLGPFLCALLNRLDHMLTNNLQINFVVTGILARLAFYPQLLLRSYLLNSNLVLQPNIKSLIQILSNVKFKIEACSKTYNNFSLLYLKAKVFLIKRLIESRKHNFSYVKPNDKKFAENLKLNNVNLIENQNEKKSKTKKIFSMESIFSIFFKPLNEDSRDIECQNQSYQNNLVSRSELDFRNSNQIEEFYFKEMMDDDFLITDKDWEDMRSRNIAYSAVVFDEFIKELASICQEHSKKSEKFDLFDLLSLDIIRTFYVYFY